ncbi:hypothetical protein ACPCSP_15725 [Streptomyces cinereoruber]|uniref:hypothetical protein n=1 Tax=Streptomyces cinereoruber TaxID=67260 RepID=UPI003C2D7A3D
MGVVERLVPDELWELFQGVVPEARVRAERHRVVLDGRGPRGKPDRPRCAIGSANMRALEKGDLTGPIPVDRGEYGPNSASLFSCPVPAPEDFPILNKLSSRVARQFAGGRMMKRQVLRAAAVVGLSGAVITGCSGSEGADRTDQSSASSSPSVEPVSAKAQAAQKVKLVVEERISVDEGQFGSGTNSPCSTSSPQMFTAKCKAAAAATSEAADLALREINGRRGFATLDSVARKLQDAVRTYGTLGCATSPTAADTRKACLEPAAVIAQGFPDLRSGANLGLAGK